MYVAVTKKLRKRTLETKCRFTILGYIQKAG